MRLRVALAGCAVFAALLAWGNIAGRAAHKPIDWHYSKIARGDRIAIAYPRSWYATSQSGRDIVISSFAVSRGWLASERKSVPEGGVYIWVFSYGQLPFTDHRFPQRPQRLELDRKSFGYYECGFPGAGYNLVFRDHGLTVQVMVALGPGADKQAALTVINRLRVS